MKQKLRLGDCYALTKQKHFNIKYISLLAVVTTMCLYAVQQVSAQEAEPAATAVADIKPLQIGDTIPKALWNLPLRVVNHEGSRDTINLNEYRGKTILLVFLSTGCSGCIKALPKLEAIQAEANDGVAIIPVTSEKRDRVATFLTKNRVIEDTQFPFVVEDQAVKVYFPHLYISHVVWIDAKGVVRATTNANHVTARTIRELQSGKPLEWPVKIENTTFFNAPLVTLHSQANLLPNNAKRPLYYSIITGYTEGVGPFMATKEDSLMGIERVSYRNRSILDLYLIALGKLYKINQSQIIWEVDDPSKYDPDRADLSTISMDQWYQRHAVCYERTIPLGTNRNVWSAYMLSDLNNQLGLYGRLETKGSDTYFILSKNNQN